MIRTGLVAIFFLMVNLAMGQQDRMLLIDADSAQPFFVRLGDTTYTSSAIGHLTIPHVKDGTYMVSVGFPENIYPEHQFTVKVSRKDQGFQLKYLGDKKWALYNWQTQEYRKAREGDSLARSFRPDNGVRKDDAFSHLMADVVNDTLVLYNTYVEPPQDTAQPVPPEPAPVVKTSEEKPKEMTRTGKKEAKGGVAVVAGNLLPVQKLSEESWSALEKMVFAVRNKQGGTDTVTLYIPLDNAGTPAAQKEKKKKGKADNQAPAVVVSKTDSVAGAGPAKPAVTECRATASDYDVDVLRTAILTANGQAAKLDAARKLFGQKCVTVKQVTALSELFAGDKAKYEFFQTAYPAISNKTDATQLAALLSDPAYKQRLVELALRS